MPIVSVIVPVYNVEPYLPSCLDSLIHQTLQDIEIICVNDGSSDNSLAILKAYASLDSRLRVIHQSNKGLSAARNTGMKQARGEYITFVDSDDVLHSQALSVSLALACQHKADLVSFPFQGFTDKVPTDKYLKCPEYRLTEQPLQLGFSSRVKFFIPWTAWGKLYKHSLVRDIEFIEGIQMEDYPFVCAVLSKHPKTISLETAFYYYRANPDSISRKQASVQQIKDYMTGINYVCRLYSTYQLADDKIWLAEHFIPLILKDQLYRIRHSPNEIRPEMYRIFTRELAQLKTGGWLSGKGHSFLRYMKYQYLLLKENVCQKYQ